jgi:hypothetical protein
VKKQLLFGGEEEETGKSKQEKIGKLAVVYVFVCPYVYFSLQLGPTASSL